MVVLSEVYLKNTIASTEIRCISNTNRNDETLFVYVDRSPTAKPTKWGNWLSTFGAVESARWIFSCSTSTLCLLHWLFFANHYVGLQHSPWFIGVFYDVEHSVLLRRR